MIFISYPRKRVAIAHLIKLNLELRGYNVFMDLTELKGGEWNDQLRAAIKKSTDVLVIVSPESLSSSAIAAEMDYANSLKKHIVPIIIDKVEPRDTPWLQVAMKYQAITTFDERLPSQSTDLILKLIKSKKGIVSTHETKRFEFFQNVIGVSAAVAALLLLFFTNPDADTHVQKIGRGPYANWKLDREFFYDDYLIYSEMYIIGKDDVHIAFSRGLLGKVFELEDFNYNLQRRLK